MPRIRLTRAVSVFLVLALAGPTFAADAVLLRRVYKAGDRYGAVMASEQEIAQTAPDGTVNKVKQTQRSEMALEVLALAPDGAAQAKVTYRRIAFAIDSPGLKIDYDSGDPAKKDVAHPILNVSKVLAGKSITATVNDRGEVSSVGGIDEIVAGVLATVPEGANRDQAKASLTQALGPESFKQQLSIFGMPLPAEAKAVGDSWNWDQNVNLGFVELSVRTTCKVEAVTDRAVELSVASTMQAGKTASGVTVALDPASRNAGKAAIERANAALSTGSSSSSLAMTITVRNQTFNSRTTGASTVTVTKQ